MVNQDDLGAVGHEAYLLRGRLSRDGDHARPATFDAAIALTNSNFTSGPVAAAPGCERCFV